MRALPTAPRLKRGWELWLGAAWAEVTTVRVEGEHVLIGVAGGRTYRAGYLDAVRCHPVSSAHSHVTAGLSEADRNTP